MTVADIQMDLFDDAMCRHTETLSGGRNDTLQLTLPVQETIFGCLVILEM